MRAIVITKPGGPEVLAVVERPLPEPSRGEVRVRVRATAVNRADLLQRMGHYPAPADSPPDVPGLEIAGEVDQLGAGVERWKIGDRVFGLVGGGGYAEYVVTHERALAEIPEGMSFEQAAAVPEAFITAHDAMVTQAGLRSGETVLITAVGSGVGTAAMQLAHAMHALVVGTARTPEKLGNLKGLGLRCSFVPIDGKYPANYPAPNVILELVGGSYLAEDLKVIQPQGRIVLVGLLAGRKQELDLGSVLSKRVRIFGTVLRARPLEEKIAATRAFETQVVPLFGRGLLKPITDIVLPLAEASRAHERMASNETLGKIVLSL